MVPFRLVPQINLYPTPPSSPSSLIIIWLHLNRSIYIQLYPVFLSLSDYTWTDQFISNSTQYSYHHLITPEQINLYPTLPSVLIISWLHLNRSIYIQLYLVFLSSADYTWTDQFISNSTQYSYHQLITFDIQISKFGQVATNFILLILIFLQSDVVDLYIVTNSI